LVDNTLLAAEAKCQTAATIRHIYERSTVDESVTLVSGQAIHKALEAYFKGGSASEALWVLEAFYKPWWERACKLDDVIRLLGGDAKVLSDRRSYENVRTVLVQWFATHPKGDIPFVPDVASVEASFEVPLIPEEGIWYTGTPDIGRVVTSDGATWAVDHKSTGRMTAEWRRNFRTSGQVSGYVWGLQQVHGVPYTGLFVNAIELTKVPSSNRKCNEHGVQYAECGVLHCQSDLIPVQRTAEELERWKQTACMLARRYVGRLETVQAHPELSVTDVIAGVAQEGKITGACGFCEHYDWCGSGQAEWLFEARYQKREWDPAKRDPVADVGEEA
jgi:hypothetical protein